MTLRYISFCCFLFVSTWCIGSPFPCNNDFFIISNSVDGSILRRLVLNPNQPDRRTAETVGSYPFKAGPLGYNTRDRYIYTLGVEDFHLYKLHSNGDYEDLGFPVGLDTTLVYNAGDYVADGRSFLIIGHDPAEAKDSRLFSIRITPSVSAGYVSVVSAFPAKLEDLATDPVFGAKYAYDSSLKSLTFVAGSGHFTNYAYEPNVDLTFLHSIFFDEGGELYGVGTLRNVAGQQLIHFDKRDGAILSWNPVPVSGFSDGCSCPYRMKMEVRLPVREVLPCGIFDVEYHIFSKAGAPFGGLDIAESFDEDLTLEAAITPVGYGGSISGFGTSNLNFEGLAIVLGHDSITLSVRVDPDASGFYPLQAEIYNLPSAFPTPIFSDDPFTLEPNDPVFIEIIDESNLFPRQKDKICQGGSLTLQAPLGGINYLWNTGETTASIDVEDGGMYWVEIETDCNTYRDTIQVKQAEELLTLSLEPISELSLGQEIVPQFSSNVDVIAAYDWDLDAGRLSCFDCPNPTVEISNNAILSLTIQDTIGCEASSALEIALAEERELFVPNIFTPNGDGQNEIFFAQAPYQAEIQQFMIYDRWGLPIYSGRGAINDQSSGWDGQTVNGDAPEGVYLWWIELLFEDGKVQRFTGDATLIR